MNVAPFYVDLKFTDGTTETLEKVTEEVIEAEGGVVTFYRKLSEWAVREHVGSYPLTSLRMWKKSRSGMGAPGF